jgi:HSP20 family protein
MGTQMLAKSLERMPSMYDDFFKPFNELFDTGLWGRVANMPAANIKEQQGEYLLSLAVPGLKKDDFNIDIDGNLITISSEKEESKEDTDEKYTRKEYNYTSFKRCFTLPDDVNKDNIEASYADGVLKLVLPKKEEAKKMMLSKHIVVN